MLSNPGDDQTDLKESLWLNALDICAVSCPLRLLFCVANFLYLPRLVSSFFSIMVHISAKQAVVSDMASIWMACSESTGVFTVAALMSISKCALTSSCIDAPSRSFASMPKGFSSSIAIKFKDHSTKTRTVPKTTAHIT